MSTTRVSELRELLGPDVLLLHWATGSKGEPRQWGRLTVANMTPAYLAKLETGNIGVALGEKSGGLCCIDFDEDLLIAPFLMLNPSLNLTLQTHGARGRVFWVRFIGDYPERTFKFRTPSGDHGGEFRSNGCQSIISGIHPNGKPYVFVHRAKPLAIEYCTLAWPHALTNAAMITGKRTSERNSSESCILNNCIPVSLPNCDAAPLHNNSESIRANILARKEAFGQFVIGNPARIRLLKYYTDTLEPRFPAEANGRNHFITQAVPFLYRAVAPPLVLQLACLFYDCNRTLFHDSRDQHMREAKTMLGAAIKTYSESLNGDERTIYGMLDEFEQIAFRICRDLAQLPEPNRDPLTFFLSFEHLGDRLGTASTQAQRLMLRLEKYGLIRQLTKGKRRAPGVKGEAGFYRWKLSPATNPVQSHD